MRRLVTDLAAIFDVVRTSRLVLRRPRDGDAPALFAIDGDPATHRFTPTGPAPDLASCEQRLRRWLAHWEEEGYGYWTVTLPETEQIIGFGGVAHDRWRDRDVLNLFYRLTPSAWGRGYAAELARTAVALAREQLPPWPVIARARPGNVPAIRTAERAGLRRQPDLDTEHVILALGWPEEALPSSPPEGRSPDLPSKHDGNREA